MINNSGYSLPICDQGENRIDTVRTFHCVQGCTFEHIDGTLTPVRYVGVGMSDKSEREAIDIVDMLARGCSRCDMQAKKTCALLMRAIEDERRIS